MQKVPDFEECMLTSAFQIAPLPPMSATVSISDTPPPSKMLTYFMDGPLHVYIDADRQVEVEILI